MIRARAAARPVAMILVLVAALPNAPARAAPFACPPPDIPLEGSPRAPGGNVTPPVRTEPDGTETITLTVEDPQDASTAYQHVAVRNVQGDEVGYWRHGWTDVSRSMVTYGIYVIREGTRRRIPLFIVENAPSEDIATSAVVVALNESLPLLYNATPFALNTLFPTSLTGVLVLLLAGGLVPGGGLVTGPLASAWWMHNGQYPANVGYADQIPIFVWTTYRTGQNQELWQGMVLAHTGRFQQVGAKREGCRRTRINEVVRTTSGTTVLGGIWMLEHSTGQQVGPTFTAQSDITVGMTGATTDVPVANVRQTEAKEGAVLYATYQKDEVQIGVMVGNQFVPLVGTRAEAWHAPPPDAERRLVAVGVFDPLGTYHPVLGVRLHFERLPSDLWLLVWALTGGPGTQIPGDWEADVGTFDPSGTFVPLVGTTYDDAFDGGLFPYEMMITVGAWAGATYEPALGLTYDGQNTLVEWALYDVDGAWGAMGRWYVSTGTFNPVSVAYVPVAGAAYQPGTPTAPWTVYEEYQVGVYPGSYSSAGTSSFIPLAQARWSGTQTSASWAAAFATGLTKAPSNARIDVGPVTPVTGFVPAAGLTATAGRPDRYGVGVWAGSMFVTAIEACYTPGAPGRTSVGVAAGGGDSRVPLGYAGTNGNQPEAGALKDCPA